MRLLSVHLARSIWLCHIFEFNPKGKSLYSAAALLVNLYKFKRFPSQTDIQDFEKGIKFEDGEFRNSEGDVISLRLTLYTDGLVVDTSSSTKDSDAFLTEMLTRISKDFDLPSYEQIIRKKTYLSQLYITTDKSLELINPKLKEISKYLSDNLSHPFEAGGISFWPDQTMRINLPAFTFERVLNLPFAEKRYYSSAPLETEKHLELLEKLENILSGN